QNAFRERRDALYVEFVDCFGAMLDLGERQFLAQLVALAAVAGEVDRLGVEERFVVPVELLLDRLNAAVLLRRMLVPFRTPLLPDTQDSIFDQAHVAGSRPQERKVVDEDAFERCLAHVDRSALTLAVVVRVVLIASLRPATRQRTAADVAAHETPQRKVRVI